MNKAREMRDKDTTDLLALKKSLKQKIFECKSVRAPENKDALHTEVRKAKKTIARIETVLTEREHLDLYNEISKLLNQGLEQENNI